MTDQPSSADSFKQQYQSTAPTGLKRFTPISLRRKSQGWQVQIYWRRLFVCLLVFAMFGWLGLASAAYLTVKYRLGFPEVQFVDMMLFRREKTKVAQGNYLIRVAQEQLKKQKIGEAFYGARIGLQKAPENKEGRILLFQFYTYVYRRHDLARQIILGGFKYHSTDLEYLKTLFSYLLQQQDDQQVLAYYKQLLADDATITQRNQLVALAAATASYFRGNYDEAENILRKYQLENSRDGRLLAIRISWDRGDKEAALERLRALSTELPNDEEVYVQTVTYLRDSGRDQEARRESFVRSLANPQNARARIDQLYALQKEGDTAAVNATSEEIFRDFSKDSNALLALADFAANTGNPALALRIYNHTKANNLNWEGAALMTVEANIVAKQYQAALEMVRQLLKDNPEWGKRYYSIFNGLQAIALYGLGDAEAAQLFLNNFLTQTNIRADNLIAVSKRLLAVGAKAQARQVLDQAVNTDALNQAALTSLVQLDLEMNHTATLAGNVRKLLTMRRPSQEILRSAYRKIGSDLFLFAPERTTLLNDLQAMIKPTATSGS